MGDEEYYFEDEYNYDDGGDGGGEGEEDTWETEVENTYVNAKSIANTNPAEAIRMFEECIKKDEDKGSWSFKAYKRLVRTSRAMKDYDRMQKSFADTLNFKWSGRNRTDIEKFINKFLEQSSQVPQEVMERIYAIALDVIEKDRKTYERLWFNIRMRVCQQLFNAGNFEQLRRDVEILSQWCWEGADAEQRKGTQILTLYSMEIQMYSELNDLPRLREIYTRANNIKAAIPPPKVMGIIRESGGKTFMRQSMWEEAYEAFFQAFRNFDEAGDPRRISCLKYLILATMLSGSKINPFSSNEAASYKQDPEIVAMTELIDACERNDIKQFDRVLKDKKNRKSIMEDKFLYTHLEPLIRRVRKQVIEVLVKPYTTIRFKFIAKELQITEEEAESLVVGMILDKQLNGQIDQINGLLRMSGAGDRDFRAAALEKWVSKQRDFQEAIVTRCSNLV